MQLQHVRKAWQIIGPFRKTLVIMGIGSFFVQILEISCFYLPAKILDFHREGLDIKWLTAMFVASILLLSLVNLNQWVKNLKNLYYPLELSLATTSLGKVLGFSLSQLTENSELRNECIRKGEYSIARGIDRIYFEISPLFFQLLATTVSFFSINVKIGLYFITGLCIFLGLNWRVNRKIMPKVELLEKEEEVVKSHKWEIMANADLAILKNKQQSEIERYCKDYGEYAEKGKKLWIDYVCLTAIIRLLTVFPTLTCLFFISVGLVSEGKITYGDFFIVISLSLLSFTLLAKIGQVQRDFIQYKAQIKNYLDFLDIKPETERKSNQALIKCVTGDIVLENVWCRALRGINLTIKEGETINIVGLSGSGKSTLKHVILGTLTPTKGRVLLDGHDFQDIDQHHRHEQIGLVRQEMRWWTNKSLAENIRYGLNKGQVVTDDEIMQLLDEVHLPAFANIGSIYKRMGDLNLSGGEQQRVALLRAMISNPSMYMFDEPTSALDPTSAIIVEEAIKRVTHGKTCIIVTHRMKSLLNAKKIVVMNEGEIVDIGCHEELLVRCPDYEWLVAEDRSKWILPIH